MQHDREFVGKFITAYRSLPCLWNRTSREYSDRKMKSQAYTVLIKLLQTKDPQSNRQSVVKKINSLRTAYRKELKKVLRSKNSGAAEKDLYVPRLWYFELLHFLEEQEFPKERKSNQIAEDDTLSALSSTSSSTSSSRSSTKPALRPKGASKSRLTKCKRNDLLNVVEKLLARIPPVPDRFNSIATAWTCKLKELAPLQALHAEKLINDVFYEAQLGNLHHGCNLQIPPIQLPNLTNNNELAAVEGVAKCRSTGDGLKDDSFNGAVSDNLTD